ncbi:LOW QUALITY PROTEIN: neurotensin receptor type 1-like [Lampetra planeri]
MRALPQDAPFPAVPRTAEREREKPPSTTLGERAHQRHGRRENEKGATPPPRCYIAGHNYTRAQLALCSICLTITITISVEERGVKSAIMNYSVHAAAAGLRPTPTVAAHSSSSGGIDGIGVNDSAHDNSSGQQSLEISTSLGSKAFITALYVALFVVGTVGNAVTLYVVLRKRSARHLQHGTAHYHLVSMAASDLLTLMLALPVELYNFIWVHEQWAFGDLGCRGYHYLRDSCTYATVLNITSLSVERYLAVCHPLRAMTVASPRRTRRLVAAVWVTSFLLALPMALVMGQQVFVERRRHGFVDEHVAVIHVCTNVISIDTLKVVIQVNVFLAFVFPMLAISALNSAIVRQLMRLVDKPAPEPDIGQEQGCVARSRGDQGGGLQACRHATALNLGRRLCSNGGVEAARVHALCNSVKVLRAIVIAFVVCWLPYHSRRLMFCYVPDSAWHPAVFNFYHYFYMLTNTLYYVSSAINPVLYNLVSAGFRHTFVATLGCGRAKEREPGTMQVYTRAGSSQSSVHTVTSSNHDCAAPCSNPGRAREALS